MVTIATVVIAIFTVVLSIVTYWYARTANKILSESQRSRQATESLADSSQQSTQIMKQH